MASLSTQSYKGTRDYYPEDKRVQNYIFKTWAKVAENFGYEEYGAPLLEPLELYAAKSGQELTNEQTYAFIDRGDRTVTIRPEMTPSLARMVAARRQEMAMPARLYSIANFMRYERPQRGREREFWQMNVDIFGVDNIRAEAEIITMAHRSLTEFGADESMFTIKVNNRKLVDYTMTQYLKLDVIQSQLMVKLFDRKDKISAEEFRDQAMEIFGGEAATDGLNRISSLLSARTIAELPELMRESPAIEEIQELCTYLEQSNVHNVRFDVTLMRGLDYYTGTVFEVFDTNPENRRALFGGGRYDGLVGLFGVEPAPTVGMGLGATTVQQFLETHKLLPELISTTELYMIVLGDVQAKANQLAEELREEGVNVEVDITARKLDKQIKTAVKKSIPYIVFIGEEELTSGVYPLKDTKKSDEQKVDLARMITIVKDRRRKNDDDFDIF